MSETALKIALGIIAANGAYRGFDRYRDLIKGRKEKDDALLIEKIESMIMKGLGCPIMIAFGASINVMFTPVAIYRNLKRVEILIRGLEEKKKEKWYDDII